MLSPVELENKKMYAKGRKYHKLDVDEYLELVYANYKELFNENEELKKPLLGDFPGGQWVRLCTCAAGNRTATCGWGTQILHVTRPKTGKQKARSRLVYPGLWEDCEKRHHGAGKRRP